jgi:hypothetical protein
MNNPFLISIFFLILGFLCTYLFIRRLNEKDMSTSGMVITPDTTPTKYKIEVIRWCLGSLFFYAGAVIGFMKFLKSN